MVAPQGAVRLAASRCCPSDPPAAPPRTICRAGPSEAAADHRRRWHSRPRAGDACIVRGLPYLTLPREVLDVAEPARVAAALAHWRPWAVVNAAGFARVDRAETRPNIAVARMSAVQRFSRVPAPQLEFLFWLSPPTSCSTAIRMVPTWKTIRRHRKLYGVTKAEAEQVLLAAFSDVLLVRSGAFFGPWDDRNLVTRAVRTIASGRRFPVAMDITVSPTYLPDLANAALDLLLDRERGVWHLASSGSATWAELVREAVCGVKLNSSWILEVPSAALGWIARRPAQSVLSSSRGTLMSSLENALGRYLDAFTPTM